MKAAKVLKMLTEVAMHCAEAGASFLTCVRLRLRDGQKKPPSKRSVALGCPAPWILLLGHSGMSDAPDDEDVFFYWPARRGHCPIRINGACAVAGEHSTHPSAGNIKTTPGIYHASLMHAPGGACMSTSNCMKTTFYRFAMATCHLTAALGYVGVSRSR